MPSQYEFKAVWRSVLVAKAVPADTGLKLLAAVIRSRGRAREYLVRIMMLDVWNILVIIFPGKKNYVKI